tara:strand:+ start:23663 stop:24955 length:1293 start_codon:yes stop_codon:yes gene_type:complete
MSKREKESLDGIKRGWGKRLWSTGKLAASAAQLATRQVLGARGEQDRVLGETLAKEMDKMKGMAMKVGQILSYFDGILPEETHAALRSLQQGVQPVAFEKMKASIEEAFGQPLEELFERFEEEPIASASIGQVYRGRLDGHDVAVKAQYPGIAETIMSDFSMLQHISRIATLATSVDGPAIVRELRERFAEECDYIQEARHQRAFREAFIDTPEILIPRVFAERTCQTVITSEWCDGDDFYTFAARASREEKDVVARLLMRFAYECMFSLGMLNADPHPGNYLFPQDGRVVFLDFGCVKHFPKAFLAHERRLQLILMDNRKEDFRDALMETGMVAKPKKFDFDAHWEMLRHMSKPYTVKHFRFTSDYIKRGMEYNQPSNTNMLYLAIPPEWIWWQRLQWGLHAVLMRLDAEGDFQTLFRDILSTSRVGDI